MKKDTTLKIAIAILIAGLQVLNGYLGKEKPSRGTRTEGKQK